MVIPKSRSAGTKRAHDKTVRFAEQIKACSELWSSGANPLSASRQEEQS